MPAGCTQDSDRCKRQPGMGIITMPALMVRWMIESSTAVRDATDAMAIDVHGLRWLEKEGMHMKNQTGQYVVKKT
eukprot:651483-Pelagomonas_calceolata.AAC.8